jgi:hypothetical protein
MLMNPTLPSTRRKARWLRLLVTVLFCLAGPAAVTGASHPVLHEVLYDGPGTDPDDVFTEITGPAGTILTGWKLIGINGDTGEPYRTITFGTVIMPADGVLVVATAAAAGQALAQRDVVADVDWQNGPDAVQLTDASGQVIDALQYGDAAAFNRGEGRPAPTVAAGQSLSRDASSTDTNDNLTDFAVCAAPTPGVAAPGTSAAGRARALALPDTAVVADGPVSLPLRLRGPAGAGIVAAEVFISFDRTVLAVDSVSTAAGILGAAWTVVSHVVTAAQGNIDTLRTVMATGTDTLADQGVLFTVHARARHLSAPGSTRLGLEHAVFNRDLGADTLTHGRVHVVGTTGRLDASPVHLPLPGVLHIEVADADENRDPATTDSLSVAVVEGSEVESLVARETGVDTGVFTAAVSAVAAPSVPGDGVLQTQPGRVVALAYADSLDSTGTVRQMLAYVQAAGGADGVLTATRVIEPGDTLCVQLVDPDLNTSDTRRDTAWVWARIIGHADSAAIAAVEAAEADSVFVAALPTTASPSSPGRLAVAGGDVVVVSYRDLETVQGEARGVADTTQVIGAFGDVDRNGATQTYDAALVLGHVVMPSLAGLDSLAANLDDAAPDGGITPMDASLILQQRVGLLRRFPVQERRSRNHPHRPGSAELAKPLTRACAARLTWSEDQLVVTVEDRGDLVAGDLVLSGIAGEVVPGDGMGDYLVAWRAQAGNLRVVLAGARPVRGQGELVRIRPTWIGPQVRLVAGVFDDGAVQAEVDPGGLAGAAPLSWQLHRCYPNPFNPTAQIAFETPAPAQVAVSVLDPLGRQVRTLVAGMLPAGMHRTVWDGLDDHGRRVASGVYLCRLQAGQVCQLQRLALVR